MKPTRNFINAYALFLSREIAIYSQSILKLINPQHVPDYSVAIATRNEVFHCIELSTTTAESIQCLDPVRKFMTNDQTLLQNFVSSYSRLYRISRFWFMTAQLTEDDLKGTSLACNEVIRNMTKIEEYKYDLNFPSNMSNWKFKETYHYRDIAINLLPYPKNTAGAEFTFNLGSYQAVRLICPIPMVTGLPWEKQIQLLNNL